jgi:hypothetical protein
MRTDTEINFRESTCASMLINPLQITGDFFGGGGELEFLAADPEVRVLQTLSAMSLTNKKE